jgi:hypothetical protein
LARAYAGAEWDIDAVAQIEGWLLDIRNAVVTSYGMTFQST